MLQFHRFHVPVAAVRPGTLTLVFLFLFFLVTLTDALRSMDVLALYSLASRDLGRFRVTCHRLAYSYVSIPISRDSYYTCMCHGDPPRLFFVMLTFHDYASYSSPVMSTRLMSRFFLRPVLYPTTLPLVHLPNWTLFLSCTLSVLTPVCTCIVPTRIYTGLEMGRSPSSIYFATTLVL